MNPTPAPVTVPRFTAMKAEGRRIAMLTAYDHLWAAVLDEAGVDGILVGDSLGMVVQGRDTTLPVTLDEIVYHAEMVGRAVRRALVVVDMPFLTFHVSPEQAVANAGRILKETRCRAVKLEGGQLQAETIRRLTAADIPVMAHVGLRPQSVHRIGGYRVQRDEGQLVADARAAEQAGAFAIVVECVPAETAAKITAAVSIPTIGIGAGAGCDGQVLVTQDLLGLTDSGFRPRFVKRYAELRGATLDAVRRYCGDVQAGSFPGEEHSFK